MSRKTKKILGWSYALLIIVGLGVGISQAVASPPAEQALNCFTPCPPGGDDECNEICKGMDFTGGACNPANQCCCLK